MKETLKDRIAFLVKFCRGTMPVGMVVDTEREAKKARAILKQSKKKAAKLIYVQVDEV